MPCLVYSPLSCLSLPILLVWMNVSFTPWLSDFHAVWFPSRSGCLLFVNWLLSFLWLFEKVKYFYLCLHLGQNSDKERILKAAREKERVTYKEVPIRLSADFSKETLQLWLVQLSELSTSLSTKGSPIWFLVRTHAWVAGHVPSWGCMTGNHTLMFLPLFPPTFHSL